jgi:beta-carotene hydroxylase
VSAGNIATEARIAPAVDEAAPRIMDPARRERAELLRREREIAAKYMGGSMWGYSISALGGFALWVALFPLTMAGMVPIWLAFVVSTFLATCGYIVSHEAMHSNIARKGEKLRWLNELVGQVSTIPLIFPFSMARMMHLHHHYHCNDPVRDPDYPDGAENAWKAVIKTWLNRQPGADGSIHHYKRILASIDSPAARQAERETAFLQLFAMAFFFAMAWSGYALEVAALWWLPRHIGLSYIRFFLSWAPHHPRTGHDRYSNTRVFKSKLGHVLSMCMETHIVHHLYPSIPNHRTRKAYLEMKDILAARGVDVSAI